MKRILSMILALALVLYGMSPMVVKAEHITSEPTAEWAAEHGWEKSNSGYTKTIDGVVYELIYTCSDYEELLGSEPYNQIFTKKSPDAEGKVTILSEIDGYQVTSVGKDTFRSNRKITECVISPGVEVIRTGAFQYCANLEKITIGEGMKVIGHFAFYLADKLREVTLPSSLEYLSYGTFSRNGSEKGLQNLTFKGDAPTITDDRVGKGMSAIEGASVNVYEGTTGWDSEIWTSLNLNKVKRVDWDSLDAALEEAATLVETDYTLESWQILQNAIDAAKTLSEDSDADTVEAVTNSIRSAIDELIFVEGITAPTVDRTRLDALIEEAGLLEEEKHTKETWMALQDALAEAEALENPSQYLVNKTAENIQGKMEALVLLGDKTELETVIKQAEGLVETDYTLDSWNAMLEVLADVQAVMSNEEALQAPVDQATAALAAAIQDLVLRTEVSVTEIFSDVHNDWYTDYVQHVYVYNLMTGIKGTDRFEPNANITKAQVAQVLYNMENQPEVIERKIFNDLKDVYAVEWYADAVAWAYSTGVVTGDLNTKMFQPNANVTREQLALMLYRYANSKGYAVNQSSDLAGLKNAENTANWALAGVKWAVGTGLISGIEKDGVKDLAPQGNATRAQMAAILQRFCETYGL